VILRAKTTDGAPVTDESGQEVGTVAQTGRIVLHGMKADTGDFSVKSGDSGNQQCRLSYALPESAGSKTIGQNTGIGAPLRNPFRFSSITAMAHKSASICSQRVMSFLRRTVPLH